MQRLTFLLFVTLIGLLGGAGWLVWKSSGHKAAFLAERQLRNEEKAAMEAQLTAAEAEESAARERLETMEWELQTQIDRGANLTAQRDHLQSELERLQSDKANHQSQARKWQGEIEALRLEVIRLTHEPAQLRAERESLSRQMDELEQALDAATASSAATPEAYELQGLSADQRVFSLAGPLPADLALPAEILLCKGREIVAEGWLNRVHEDLLLGHIKDWHIDTSELVKGTKVFIVSLK